MSSGNAIDKAPSDAIANDKIVKEVTKDELSETQLDTVSAGNIGSQSSGAGAGKVTFNPF